VFQKSLDFGTVPVVGELDFWQVWEPMDIVYLGNWFLG
jgi:hypothetical protein